MKNVLMKHSKLVRDIGPGITLLIILSAGFSYFAPEYYRQSNINNIIRQASPLFIASVGQMLVVLVAGIDISTGAVVAFSSVCGALAAVNGNAAYGVAAALLSGFLAGGTSGLFVTVFRVQPVIATIGMLSIARGFALVLSGGEPVDNIPDAIKFLGTGEIAGLPVPFFISAGVFALVGCWLSYLPSGRSLFAIGGSDEAAKAAGISVRTWRTMAYALAGALAGLAALIYAARSGSGQPTFGYGLELQTIGAVVLGGTTLGGGHATLIGTAIGALIITVLSNGMDLTGVSPYIQNVVLGIAIVAIVVFDRLRRLSSSQHPVIA